jgi:trigger factor
VVNRPKEFGKRMTVKVEVETLDAVRRRLCVEVPAGEVDAALDNEYARLARTAKVPGFRPGRAPRHVLRQLFGQRVQAEVFDHLIHDSLVEAIEKEGIQPVGRPEVVTRQARSGDALLYSATLEVKPDIVVGNYKGIDVERPVRTVPAADVDRYLQGLREAMAQLRPVTDRNVVEPGDVVRVDYEATLNDRVVGEGEGRNIEMGANGFPPEFDRNMLASTVGSTLEFDVPYPDDAAYGPLGGKQVSFRVKILGLSTKDLPALDDEFAKDQGDCATLDELRERARRQLQQRAENAGDEVVRRSLVRRVVEGNELTAPRAMVERRVDALIEDTRREWERAGRWPRQDSALRERLRPEFHPQAEYEVKVELLLEAIVRQEGLTVSDAEVEERIAAIAGQADQAAEQVRSYYNAPEAKRALRVRMLQARAVDTIVQHAKIRDVENSSVADPGETG